jgi:hypothetical protein
MYNFAKEVHTSVMSPVWKYSPARQKAARNLAASGQKPERAEKVLVEMEDEGDE